MLVDRPCAYHGPRFFIHLPDLFGKGRFSFLERMMVDFRRSTHASVASKMTHSKPIQTTIPFTWVFGKTLAKYLPRFFEVITISPFETKVIRHCSWINNCTSGFYSEFSATGIMACITTWYHWYTSNRTK